MPSLWALALVSGIVARVSGLCRVSSGSISIYLATSWLKKSRHMSDISIIYFYGTYLPYQIVYLCVLSRAR